MWIATTYWCRMSKIASNTFGSENDKCTTSATSNVAVWINNSSSQKAPELASNPELSHEFGFAAEQAVWRQHFVVLVHKHTQASSGVLNDCETLSDAALNVKYSSEYQSWRNMLRRSEDGIREVHPAFHDFRLFLASVGAKPKPSYTLDRPNNADIQYSPTNARWATKREENRNKSDTVIVICPHTGKKWFAAELAKKRGVMPDTIRTQRRRGWTDAELIAGHRLPFAAADDAAPSIKPVTTLEPDWVAAMSKYFPDKLSVLSPAGKKQLGYFENLCRDAGVSAAAVLTSVIADWPNFVFEAAYEKGLRTDGSSLDRKSTRLNSTHD